MITIVTINLNNITGLKYTIDSVLIQQEKNIEYIVIDGGSTDGSVELIKSYGGKISFWISEPDRGIYNAMNKGVKLSKGDYLLFLNSGDSFNNKDSLSKLAEHISNYELIYGDLLITKQDHSYTKKYPDILTFDFFYNWESLPHPATLISKTLFDKVGLYREDMKISSDGDFFIKALLRYNASYYHVEEIITVFDGNGISGDENYKPILEKEREIILQQFSILIPDYNNLSQLQKENIYWKNSKAHRIAEKINNSTIWNIAKKIKKLIYK